MSNLTVNVDNFARAESDRMFAAIQAQAGGANRWFHYRKPTPVEQQTVIRMNRDTLYSAAIVDISAGARLTIPDAGRRYVSVMIVNQDHYINAVFHDPGEHELTIEQFGTPHVLAAARVLELAKGLHGYEHSFGTKDEADPVHHLIATAGGWGGLPDHEATYLNVNPGLPPGEYQLTVRDVPVDGFWSISLYNAAGYFERNDRGAYSVNNLTATPNKDGSVTVHFGDCGDGRPNCLPIMDRWNYLIRLYRPRPEILDGTWTFPAITPAP